MLCGACQEVVLDSSRTPTTSFAKECSNNENNYVCEPDTHLSHLLTVRILKNEKIDRLCQMLARKSSLRNGNGYEDTKYW